MADLLRNLAEDFAKELNPPKGKILITPVFEFGEQHKDQDDRRAYIMPENPSLVYVSSHKISGHNGDYWDWKREEILMDQPLRERVIAFLAITLFQGRLLRNQKSQASRRVEVELVETLKSIKFF